MLRGGNPLTVGVGIVIEVIRKNNSDYDVENSQGPIPKSSDPIYLGTLLRQFATNVPKFMELINGTGSALKNGTVPAKRELKVAFGDKIEPLGFDRFKTCELMAELLHCSNMALLNERGAEAEVTKRDTERDRLKAEGKLAPGKLDDETAVEFSTSVDSQGFHHARVPSISESPEEIKRPDLATSTEEEFENVNASDALGDEMKDDTFDEKELMAGETLRQNPSPTEAHNTEKADRSEPNEVPEKKAEAEAEEPASAATIKLSSTADQADSPTSAGLTERLGSVELDQDTVMHDADDEPAGEPSPAINHLAVKRSSGDYRDISPHPEDTPAPLFAGKKPQEVNSEASEQTAAPARDKPEAPDAPPTAETESGSVLHSGQEENHNTAYTVDIDGTPVVGDLLKIQFVENKVVPTILVGGGFRVGQIMF
jgi:SIT4-associating protein SAP185/190